MGLRETKKADTRAVISNVATRMFLELGFDAVSVADVAAAANVSKMTVFNYFPRKEDLLFDRNDEARTLMREALFERRKKGVSLVDRLFSLGERLASEEHAFAKWNSDTEKYLAIARASASLMARTRELREETEEHLQRLLVEAAEAPQDDPIAMILAVGIIAAWRSASLAAGRARRAGKKSPKKFSFVSSTPRWSRCVARRAARHTDGRAEARARGDAVSLSETRVSSRVTGKREKGLF